MVWKELQVLMFIAAQILLWIKTTHTNLVVLVLKYNLIIRKEY